MTSLMFTGVILSLLGHRLFGLTQIVFGALVFGSIGYVVVGVIGEGQTDDILVLLVTAVSAAIGP